MHALWRGALQLRLRWSAWSEDVGIAKRSEPTRLLSLVLIAKVAATVSFCLCIFVVDSLETSHDCFHVPVAV